MNTDNNAVYLVVGGSGGIGADVARQLTAKGARVIVTGRDAGRLAAIGAETGAALALNLTTAFNVLRAAVRILMRQPGGGSIVLCSSVAARRGLLNHEAIAAAKAGVEGLALAAAASYARYQVRVNCVAPGLTRTGLTRGLTQNEAVAKASAALHPLGRIGEPAEVASAICWLLDGAQAWITGQVIGVDGGLGSVQARA